MACPPALPALMATTTSATRPSQPDTVALVEAAARGAGQATSRQLAAAMMSLDRREARVMAVYDRLEAGLVILGATAIEDRLQQGVGDTLEAITRAGVRVWILTGDKKETAVSISLASGHLDPDMELADLTGLSTSGLLTSKLQSFHDQAKLNQGRVGLIVDGETFAMISRSNRMSGLFVKVCILILSTEYIVIIFS